MKYRPKDWKEKWVSPKVFTSREIRDIFEAGADAILEGLMEQNVTLPDVIHHYIIDKLGTLVFIPNEEE